MNMSEIEQLRQKVSNAIVAISDIKQFPSDDIWYNLCKAMANLSAVGVALRVEVCKLHLEEIRKREEKETNPTQ